MRDEVQVATDYLRELGVSIQEIVQELNEDLLVYVISNVRSYIFLDAAEAWDSIVQFAKNGDSFEVEVFRGETLIFDVDFHHQGSHLLATNRMLGLPSDCVEWVWRGPRSMYRSSYPDFPSFPSRPSTVGRGYEWAPVVFGNRLETGTWYHLVRWGESATNAIATVSNTGRAMVRVDDPDDHLSSDPQRKPQLSPNGEWWIHGPKQLTLTQAMDWCEAAVSELDTPQLEY